MVVSWLSGLMEVLRGKVVVLVVLWDGDKRGDIWVVYGIIVLFYFSDCIIIGWGMRILVLVVLSGSRSMGGYVFF